LNQEDLLAWTAYHEGAWQRLLASGAGDCLEEKIGWRTVESVLRLTTVLQSLWPELEEHLRQEETGLVPILGPFLGEEVGPLASMLREHQQIRQARSSLLSASPETGPASELQDLVFLLEDHWRKEKYVLFPLAAEVLDRGMTPPWGRT